MTDLAITTPERNFLTNKNLEQFWLSRLKKKDPIARIGYALWCKSANDLKYVISSGDSAY